jgi:hypothetical protein
MSVCVVNVDEGNDEGVCDDVLDMEKIVTPALIPIIFLVASPLLGAILAYVPFGILM